MKLLSYTFSAIFIVVFNILSYSTSISAQTLNTINDSSLTMLNSLPPEQLQGLLKMAMATMPQEQKESMEEALKHMNATQPELVSINVKGKNITFIPIAHASTPEFYAAVTDTIYKYKESGYVVYYEQIINDRQLKSGELDTVRLKFRKMMGIEPSRQTYAILKKLFPHIVPQPMYTDLGVKDTDINADVSLTDIVLQYERIYGEITLSECDYNSGFEIIMYNCGKLNNDIMPIILDYRNERVVDMLLKEKNEKIIVIYGAKHIPGMIQLLKKQL